MSLHAQTTHPVPEVTGSTKAVSHEPAGVHTVAGPAVEDHDASTAAVSIELDFNAYADNVPVNRHAKRVISSTDPSVQDFADQALELAALRAELKRLTRDYEALQLAMRSRDGRVQKLQDELAVARKSGDAARQSADQSRPALIDQADNEAVEPIEVGSEREANLSGEATSAGDLSATQELPIPPTMDPTTLENATPKSGTLPGSGRQLIPVHHEGEAIPLSRDIMTIGRTPQNDIRIPSRAVSRDHARLLIGPRSVTIVDMSSSNGCFVNDEPVKKQQLRNGDVVRIGDHSYRFSC